MLTTKEVNFSCAELVNEAREAGEAKSDEKVEKAYDSEDESDDHGYISTIRFNNRMYTKYRPHYTGVFDDYLFVNYEYKNFHSIQTLFILLFYRLFTFPWRSIKSRIYFVLKIIK